ncbi:unnamed protein product [Symbiodinium sp. CCMP2456]|nr:unnamed protein product [Symbiodinium sp. CCMP2456]
MQEDEEDVDGWGDFEEIDFKAVGGAPLVSEPCQATDATEQPDAADGAVAHEFRSCIVQGALYGGVEEEC